MGTLTSSSKSIWLHISQRLVQTTIIANYPTTEAAWIAARANQEQYCIDRKLTKNRYRIVQDTGDGTSWIEMELTQGKTCLFDCDDLDKIQPRYWHAAVGGCTFYARTALPGRKLLAMHSLITGWSLVDHRNCDGLDNRKRNLLQLTARENLQRRRPSQRNKTGVVGVTYSDAVGTYWATWCDATGKKKSKTFSVSKYGKERAFELAVNVRREMAAVYGIETRTPAKRPRGPEDIEASAPKRPRFNPIDEKDQ